MKKRTLSHRNMHTGRHWRVLLCMIAGLLMPPIVATGPHAAETKGTTDTAMTDTHHFFVKLIGTREGWPHNMNDIEQQVMQEHFDYLKQLTAEGKVLLAGPCLDPVFGMVILHTENEELAREIMDSEPSVLAGVHTYEMHPMHVSLMSEHYPSDRYVTRPSARILTKEIIAQTTLDKAWHAWTTADGVTSFFVPDAIIELRPGGRYELIIVPTGPKGQRGSEGCHVLSFLPQSMLSFEWNAPPQFGELRDKRTIVVLTFEEFGPGQIRVVLNHLGWGRGEQWNQVYDYFDRAWSGVLSAFKKFVESDDN